MPPIAALTPMPPLAPGDRPLHDLYALVVLEELEEEVDKVPEMVGVATFQPMTWIALIVEADVMVCVTVVASPESKARYVMVWPGIKGVVHVPTALPGSLYCRSYPL